MSLEVKIESLTAAVTQLIAVMSQGQQPAAAPAPVAAPVAAPPVAAMPAPPSFAPPVFTPPAATAPTGAPFTDAKGLMDYTMAAYQAMGATKGAGIQNVLSSMGIANVNDIKPEQFAQFFASVEALKAS
jgi:hypothetical protein